MIFKARMRVYDQNSNIPITGLHASDFTMTINADGVSTVLVSPQIEESGDGYYYVTIPEELNGQNMALYGTCSVTTFVFGNLTMTVSPVVAGQRWVNQSVNIISENVVVQ